MNSVTDWLTLQQAFTVSERKHGASLKFLKILKFFPILKMS